MIIWKRFCFMAPAPPTWSSPIVPLIKRCAAVHCRTAVVVGLLSSVLMLIRRRCRHRSGRTILRLGCICRRCIWNCWLIVSARRRVVWVAYLRLNHTVGGLWWVLRILIVRISSDRMLKAWLSTRVHTIVRKISRLKTRVAQVICTRCVVITCTSTPVCSNIVLVTILRLSRLTMPPNRFTRAEFIAPDESQRTP